MRRVLFTAAILLFASRWAGADPVLVSTLSGSDQLLCCGGYGVPGGGLPGEPNQDRAFAFQAPFGAHLSTVEVVIAFPVDSLINNLDLTLFADAGGLPGEALETFHLVGAPTTPYGVHVAPTTFASISHPLLTAGSWFWLGASTSGFSTAVWEDGLVPGITAFRNFDGPWEGRSPVIDSGAFELTAAPIPEPATLLLVGTGLIAGSHVRYRRRKRSEEWS